jgi:hypothetical protein
MHFYFKENNTGVAFLYYAVTDKELSYIVTHQYKQFPVRFFNKKYFSPMLSAEYARRVASERGNFSSDARVTHVVRFLMRVQSIKKYIHGDISNPRSPIMIKSHELMTFNQHIVGFIERVETINLTDSTNQLTSC